MGSFVRITPYTGCRVFTRQPSSWSSTNPDFTFQQIPNVPFSCSSLPSPFPVEISLLFKGLFQTARFRRTFPLSHRGKVAADTLLEHPTCQADSAQLLQPARQSPELALPFWSFSRRGDSQTQGLRLAVRGPAVRPGGQCHTPGGQCHTPGGLHSL